MHASIRPSVHVHTYIPDSQCYAYTQMNTHIHTYARTSTHIINLDNENMQYIGTRRQTNKRRKRLFLNNYMHRRLAVTQFSMGNFYSLYLSHP